MPTNQSNNTQKTATDRLKSTRDKLTRKIKAALKVATPEETLEVWMLMKQQELKRTTPGLSEQQMESVIKSLILELGYDIIATSPATASQEPEVQTDESEVDDLDEDNDTDFTNDNLDEDEDDFSEVSEEKIPPRKQRVPALRKVETLKASTRNGRHS